MNKVNPKRIKLESFGSICRTCLQKGKLSSIFLKHNNYSIDFSQMLCYTVALQQATEEDHLPLQICKKCVASLIAFYEFKNAVVNADTLLREILGEPECIKIEQFEGPCGSPASFTSSDNLPLVPVANGKGRTDPEFEDIKEEDDGVLVLNEIPVEDFNIKSNKKPLGKERIKDKTFQCEACGKLLSCRSSLMQHMRGHTGEKPFACDFCEKRFARAEHVTTHRRIHTGERPHSCTICRKSFVQYAALSAHLRTHSGERPHMCAICGKAFSQSVSLTYHTRTHTGETPFTCKLCNKGFAHSGNLNIHMRFHRGERPFVCTMCGRKFVTSSHLRVHIKQHTGDRPHRCNLCGKTFARSEHLKDHLVIHTGQKPHACKLCPKRYTQSSHLNRHMKTHNNKT